METRPLRTFIIYARQDEGLKNELLAHLAPLVELGFLSLFEDILPGEDLEQTISEQLSKSDLALMLVSAQSINASFFKNSAFAQALERLRGGQIARFVPIIVRPCLWDLHPNFGGLKAIPSKSGAEAEPITGDWKNRDEAWTNVARQLAALSKSLLQIQIAERTEAKTAARERKKARNDSDRFGLNSDEGKQKFREKIRHISVNRRLVLLDVVNCDRSNLADAFNTGFKSRQKNGSKNHFSFVCACPTQLPSSFGERMIFETLKDEHERGGIFFKPVSSKKPDSSKKSDSSKNERPDFIQLPIGLTLEESKWAFKKTVADYFNWSNEQRVEFEKAVAANRLPLPASRFSALPFCIEKDDWRPFLPEFLGWIRQTFEAREGGPTLLFFFIVYLEKLHLEVGRDRKALEIIDSVARFCDENDGAGHFEMFEAVPKKDLEKWFRSIGERRPNFVEPILNLIENGLDDDDYEAFVENQMLNMDDVEFVQSIVYDMWDKGEIG